MKQTGDTNAFISGHTYQGHAIGCAAGLAVQQIIIRENLLAWVRKMGELLVDTLRSKLPSSLVKEIRGLGLFQTVEFESRGDPLAKEVCALSFEKGAAVYLCSSAVDAVLFAPPFIISEEQVQELVLVFTAAVDQVLKKRGLGISCCLD